MFVELPEKLLLKPDEFGRKIGISRTKVYALIKAGMPVVPVLASMRIDETEAIGWLKARRAEAV